MDFGVMGGQVVLSEIVGMIEDATFPLYTDLSLFHAVLDPIEAHVYGLGLFEFHFRSLCAPLGFQD
jgi:hypothetical protein